MRASRVLNVDTPLRSKRPGSARAVSSRLQRVMQCYAAECRVRRSERFPSQSTWLPSPPPPFAMESWERGGGTESRRRYLGVSATRREPSKKKRRGGGRLARRGGRYHQRGRPSNLRCKPFQSRHFAKTDRLHRKEAFREKTRADA